MHVASKALTPIAGVVISLVALAVSLLTLWLTYFRDVRVESVMGQDLRVTNAVGGVPELKVKLAMRGDGPEERAVIISDLEASLVRRTTGEKITLTHWRTSNFPRILKGKEVSVEEIHLHLNDYIPDELKRREAWLDSIAKNNTIDASDVQKLREAFRSSYIGSGSITASRDDETLEVVQAMLASLPVEQADKYVYLTSGVYDLRVRLLSPSGSTVSEHRYSFSIDEFLSVALRRRLLVWNRVRLQNAV